MDTYAYDAGLPCKNPYCHSHGKPHPNCRCYSNYAQGGQICNGPHKEDCEYFADGGMIQENQEFMQPMHALDHVGAQEGLHHLLTKFGTNGRSENPHKHLEDFKDSFKRGRKRVDEHVSKLITPEKIEMKHNKDNVQALKDHINTLQTNPEQALNIGGDLGQTMPDHAAALGSKVGNTVNYLQSIKPMPSQPGPFDPVIPISKEKEVAYDRQLQIAEHPLSVIHSIKAGMLQPQDLKTLHNIYPELGRKLIQKASEALIDAKTNGKEIPWKQRQGLSMLLGQPLDFIQTPQAMQAIMKANAPTQAPQSQGKPKKATDVELKQINKVDDQLATPDQKRLMGKS